MINNTTSRNFQEQNIKIERKKAPCISSHGLEVSLDFDERKKKRQAKCPIEIKVAIGGFSKKNLGYLG